MADARATVMGHTTIDRFRYTIEQMPPAEYLASSYYERWLWAIEHLAAEQGCSTASDPAPPWRDRRRRRRRGPGRFRPGDQVRVRNPVTAGHTRVPRYLRLHVGRSSGRLRLAEPRRVGRHRHVRRARAGLHGGVRRRRPVRRRRRPHRHRRPRRERPGGTMSELTPRSAPRSSSATSTTTATSTPTTSTPRWSPPNRRPATDRARPSAPVSSPGPGSIAEFRPGCSPTRSTRSPSTSRRPCRSPCSRTRRRCTT